jgi:radical SAM protein with 4Fe4S-binding SPASM domain
MSQDEAPSPLVKIRKAVSPPRVPRAGEAPGPRPLYAVWELTMKCDQPCEHCGSRAGAARIQELSTEEILKVADSLEELGTREVALIGGEAYLRPDLPKIVEHLAKKGMRVSLQTGGRAFHAERAKTLKAAGLYGVGVSIDGPPKIHDRLRGNLGSYAAAMKALDNAREAGMVVTSNAQINRLNYQHLWELVEALWKKDAIAWQVALTVPMGRAADRPDWLLEPYMIVDVVDTLAAIQLEGIRRYTGKGEPFNIFVGNNIGYYGPHETTLRSRPGGRESFWQGCRAGQYVIGIESDGKVKGCPSLPTEPYVGGNVRDQAVREIWETSPEVRFTRDRTTDELWGFCKTCYYAETCMAGCSWTAHCTLGRRGNNPFCYHRAKQLEKQGIRERLQKKEEAPQQPYDFGRYEILEEPLPVATSDAAAATTAASAENSARPDPLP